MWGRGQIYGSCPPGKTDCGTQWSEQTLQGATSTSIGEAPGNLTLESPHPPTMETFRSLSQEIVRGLGLRLYSFHHFSFLSLK